MARLMKKSQLHRRGMNGTIAVGEAVTKEWFIMACLKSAQTG